MKYNYDSMLYMPINVFSADSYNIPEEKVYTRNKKNITQARWKLMVLKLFFFKLFSPYRAPYE